MVSNFEFRNSHNGIESKTGTGKVKKFSLRPVVSIVDTVHGLM